MLKQVARMENNKKFGALFWKSKPLKADMSINKQAFVSGESIYVSGLIDNQVIKCFAPLQSYCRAYN